MRPNTNQSRRRTRLAIATVAATVPLMAAEVSAQHPRGVSPGSPVTAMRLAESCPTFSWSGVQNADGYDLVLYRVTDQGALESVLQRQISGDARGWTPSAAQCPAPGSEYAWAVRAVTKAGAGSWSELMLFTTAGPPSLDELRRAIETLERHRRHEAPESGVGVSLDRRSSGAQALTGTAAAGAGLQSRALSTTTTGSTGSAEVVTPPASFSLNLSESLNLGGNVFKGGVPFIHNDGGTAYANTAVGLNALVNASLGSPNPGYSGRHNTALGQDALRTNTYGFKNTAAGYRALYKNTGGDYNTAVGFRTLYANVGNTSSSNVAVGAFALEDNTTGSANNAIGREALANNTTGTRNIAMGQEAMLFNTSGARNTAVGHRAGRGWSTGSYNIAIGYGSQGLGGESATIRIGGDDKQSKTFIEGISATVVSGVAVMIDTDDQLGIVASSARFKQDIRDLERVSDRLVDLRPVSFRYKGRSGDSSAAGALNPVEYGLIAEEVAEVFPDLVVYDDDGQPFTIRYHLLTPLLLAEVQRQTAELVDLRKIVTQLERKKRFRTK